VKEEGKLLRGELKANALYAIETHYKLTTLGQTNAAKKIQELLDNAAYMFKVNGDSVGMLITRTYSFLGSYKL
jgi:hypothetical protein